MVVGRVLNVDPEAWKIVDGKLFLGYSKAGHDKWAENAAENIKKADQQWERIKGSD